MLEYFKDFLEYYLTDYVTFSIILSHMSSFVFSFYLTHYFRGRERCNVVVLRDGHARRKKGVRFEE